jgi:hypothetical protein
MARPFVAGGGIQSESISDFDPRTIGGCVLWLDAADSNTVFTDTAGTTLAGNGNTVARWNDKSNSQCNATQSTAESRPAYVTNQCVRFTGVTGVGTGTQQFTFTNTSVFPVGTSPATYFFVAKPNIYNSTTSGNQILSYGSFSSGNPTHRTISFFGRPNNNIRFAYDVGAIDISEASRQNATSIISLVLDTALTVSLFANGGLQQRRDLMSTSPTFNTGSSSFVLGDFLVGGTPFYGDVSELIMFNRALQNDERQQVEGYLAWKWGMINTLPVTHPYYYAKAPQSAFQPTSFPMCSLWLDAADRNSITRAVSQWTDKSGVGNTVAKTSSTTEPSYTPIRGISYTVATQGLQKTGLTSINTTSFTVFVTFLIRSHTNSARLFSLATTSDNTNDVNGFSIQLNFTGGGGLFIARAKTSGQDSATIPSASVPLNTVHTVCVTINSGGSASVFLNGGGASPTFTPTATFTATSTTLNPSILSLGLTQAGGSGLTNGDIYETIFHSSALTTAQRQQIEGYLAWKWGTVARLPAGHPNLSAAPLNFTPNSITGCQLWLDAADSASVVGTNVTQWNDKSGNGVNYSRTFASTTVFPTYEANVQNSLSGIQIANNEQRLGPAANFQVISAGQTTIFNAMRILTGCSGTFTDVNSFQTLSFNTRQGATYDTNIAREGGGNVGVISASSYNPLNKSAIFVMNTNGGTLSLFLNGAADGSITGATTGDVSMSPTFNRDTTAVGSFYALETIIYSTSLSTAQRQQVEGYLGWKWGLQSNFPSTHPFTPANYFFNNTRPMNRYFVPPDIEGCQLWIDAADSGVVTLNGSGNVTTITDKSGLDNNVSNAGSTVTYASTLNSRPVLTFPSTGTVAGNILSTASLTRDPVNYSAFYVCRYPSSGANPIQAINFDLSTATSTTLSGATNAATSTLTVGSTSDFAVGRYIIITGVTPSGYNQIGLITAISSSTQLTVDLALGVPGVNYTSGGTVTQLTASHMFGQDGIVPNFNIQTVNYEAGTATRATTSFVYSSPTLTNNTFVLGCVRQNGVFTFSTNGIAHTTASSGFTAIGNKTTGAYSIFGGVQGLDIGEVIVYNSALTTTERQTIEGYLSWKWGIQRATNLTNPSVTSGLTYPTSHPYYNFPPVDVTPMTPALRLYKKPFDPSDLSPVIWIDPRDSTTVTLNETTNRVTQIVNKGSFAGNFTPPSGISGPLVTKSALGTGDGLDFLDFSNGGHYRITEATMESATTMALTVFPAHNGNIPNNALVDLTFTRGTFSDKTTSLSTSTGPFQIESAEMTAARTLTIITQTSHTIGNSQPVYLTINTGTFLLGAGDATTLTGEYTTASSGNTGNTIIIPLSADQTVGIMRIVDGHVRNQRGTSGPYLAQTTAEQPSTVRVTMRSDRTTGNLLDFQGRIEYGLIQFTSANIETAGTTEISLASVSSNIFTSSTAFPAGTYTGSPIVLKTSIPNIPANNTRHMFAIDTVARTFRLATTVDNAIAGTAITTDNNASLNILADIYAGTIKLRTSIDHGITDRNMMNINFSAVASNFYMPYQTPIPVSGSLATACAVMTGATVNSGGTTLTVTFSVNPFFVGTTASRTYTSVGTITLYFPFGCQFNNDTAATVLNNTSYTTTASGTDNTSTQITVTLGTTRPVGALKFRGLFGMAISATSNQATSVQLNAPFIPTVTPSDNTIILPLVYHYPGIAGAVGVTGSHFPLPGRLVFKQSSTSILLSAAPSVLSNTILYPVNGRAIENTALSNALQSSTHTIMFVTHLTNDINRNGARNGTAFQSPVIATSTSANGISGSDGTSYNIRMSLYAGAPRLGTKFQGTSPGNASLFTNGGFQSGTIPFRIITSVFNLTAGTIADVPPYSRGCAIFGSRYDQSLLNFALGWGAVASGQSTSMLNPAHLRIGGDTQVGIVYTVSNQLNGHWYEGGVGDVLIFNSILTVEQRQLVEGYLSQKYRCQSFLAGTTIATNTTASRGITGISGSGANGPYTLTYSTATAFVVGSYITVAGATGTVNGTWTVNSSNTTSVTFTTSTAVTWTSGGTIAGVTLTPNETSFIHPYNLNPTNITGQNTLDLTSATSPYAQSLVAWFDAANPNLINNANITTQANATPPTNNTAVTRWAPTSGWWANTPLQLANPVGTVTYFSTTSGNGLPGIYLGGTTSTLSLATATGAFSQYTTISSNSNFTWMIVFRPDSVSSTQPVTSVTSGTSNRLMLCSDGTFIYSNGTTSQTLTLPAGHALTSGKTHMITVYRDGTTLGYRIVSEDTTRGSGGFAAGTVTQAILAIPTFSSPTLTFGASTVTSYTTSFTGTIFEAALFRSAMTLQSMQQVEGYLAWKWGLQGSLPNSHAYKRISA